MRREGIFLTCSYAVDRKNIEGKDYTLHLPKSTYCQQIEPHQYPQQHNTPTSQFNPLGKLNYKHVACRDVKDRLTYRILSETFDSRDIQISTRAKCTLTVEMHNYLHTT